MTKRTAAGRRIHIIPQWLEEPNAGLFAQAIVEMARQAQREATSGADPKDEMEVDDDPSR
jgi:hypothetical protein